MSPRRAIGISTRRSVEREVDDELAFHLDMRVRQLVALGRSAEEARAEALRSFGDIERVRLSCVTHDQERLSTMRRTTFLDEARQDVAFALRTLGRNRGFLLVVVLTIALGIGANATVFSLVNAVLLRPLPLAGARDLVAVGNPGWVGAVSHQDNPSDAMFGMAGYAWMRDSSRAFRGLAASGRADRIDVRTASGQEEPERVRARFVSANYFDVLRVPAFSGRLFDGAEDRVIGGSPVVVVSHAYWTRRLAGDPTVVGREIVVNNVRLTVLGITAPAFHGEIVGQSLDMWFPLAMQPVLMPRRPWFSEPLAYWLLLIGRPTPGLSLDEVSARVQQDVQAFYRSTGRWSERELADVTMPVSDGSRGFSRVRVSYGTALLTLMAGVGLLLLLVCANVANLVLTRAIARTREMSLRVAIGAGRGRLVRQLLVEALVLGGMGAVIGVLFARWGRAAMLALVSDGAAPIALDTGVDTVVVAYTVAITLIATLLFGLAPALRASRVDVATALRATARSVSGGIGTRGRLSGVRLLITAQVALSLVLLVGASLFVRSLQRVQGIDTGIARDQLVAVEVDPNDRGYAGDRLDTYLRDTEARIRAVPGVTQVTWSELGIFSGGENGQSFSVPGFTARADDDTTAAYDLVGPAYAATLGARLLRGRDITAADIDGSAPVAIVNATFARFFFGDSEPLGRTIKLNDTSTVQVVGVIADVRDHSLTDEVKRRFYLPVRRSAFGDPGSLSFLVRVTGDPKLVAPQVRAAVQAADPLVPIESAESVTTVMQQSIREERLLARLATAFGVLALLLASIGLYGVMSYSVTRRTAELGLRTALGASRAVVMRHVLGDALRLVAIGAAIGLPTGLGAMVLVRSQLHGVEPIDPGSVAIALTVLGASAFLAALIPARRASRVSPMLSLSQE